MLLPISDDNSAIKQRPWVTYALILANILVWIFLQGMSGESNFTYAFSTVPAEILTGNDIVTTGFTETDAHIDVTRYYPGLQPTPIPVYFTLITSMFMHGGWMHLLGNMLYLFIFGDNIEHHIGKTKFLLFYLATGVIASLSHVLATLISNQSSITPSLGASGAISAVLGAYLFLFPQLKVRAIIFYLILRVPAYIALGGWIALQIFSSLSGKNDNVAYAAHIGGFIAGMMLVKLFAKKTVPL